MPNLNDDQFEFELKQFHPLAPEPFHIENTDRPVWHKFLVMASIAAAGVIVFVLWLVLPHRLPPVTTGGGASQLVNTQPLTLGRTKALLAASPSFKATLDAMAFQTQPAPIAQDKRSVIAEFSKERIKL